MTEDHANRMGRGERPGPAQSLGRRGIAENVRICNEGLKEAWFVLYPGGARAGGALWSA
jgi:hypothetical protein